MSSIAPLRRAQVLLGHLSCASASRTAGLYPSSCSALSSLAIPHTVAKTGRNPYASGLEKCKANYEPLSPIQFLERSAFVHPERVFAVEFSEHGRQFTHRQAYRRCRQLASAMTQVGIGKSDTVAIVSLNTLALLELHYAAPMLGAVLNAINYRLDPAGIAFILEHGEAKILFVDQENSRVVSEALPLLPPQLQKDILVIDVAVPDEKKGSRIGKIEYEAFLAAGDPEFVWHGPADEWEPIALNYTSGTTGDPKGVVVSHRGAYLASMASIHAWNMSDLPVNYLWTLPMFHANGWCFHWAVTALSGTHVILRHVTAKNIYGAIAQHDVTHMCAAPTVLAFIVQATAAERKPMKRTVQILTAAAPPPAAILQKTQELGFSVTHVYGLTETYGPASVCAWKHEWDKLTPKQQADLKSRQGVRYVGQEGMEVFDPETMKPVPHDGKTLGEVMFRGNLTMMGYLKNPNTTKKDFTGGWYHTGDLAVVHPDGYIKIQDRSKDIIISGGENISSVEVEGCIFHHHAVAAVAVVAKNDEKWGEIPCAFVTLKKEFEGKVTAQEIFKYCRDHLAHFKCPKRIVFGPLPTTSTGKVQKFKLREMANALP